MPRAFSGKAAMNGPNVPSAPTRQPTRALRAGLLALPGITGGGIFGAYDMFAHVGTFPSLDGRTTLPGRRIEPVIVAPRGETLRSSSGLTITPHCSIADCPELDLVWVPAVAFPPGRRLDEYFPPGGRLDEYFPPEVLDWLRAQHASGATIASAGSGSMLLAEAGLLDGGEATTHCYYAPLFRQRYPSVTLRPRRVLVTSGSDRRIITAGGAFSWSDLALYLIARFCGGEQAVEVAQMFVLNWRPEGQLPYATSMLSQLQHADAAVRNAQEWLTQNYTCRNPVGDVVARAGVPERTLKRRFKSATGFALLEYVQGLRLEAAGQLLENSDEPVEEIAYRVGYEDITFFRRLFRRHKGVTPAAYRRQLRAIHLGALRTPRDVVES